MMQLNKMQLWKTLIIYFFLQWAWLRPAFEKRTVNHMDRNNLKFQVTNFLMETKMIYTTGF